MHRNRHEFELINASAFLEMCWVNVDFWMILIIMSDFWGKF